MGRMRQNYDQSAFIVAGMMNFFRGENSQAVSPSEIHPMREDRQMTTSDRRAVITDYRRERKRIEDERKSSGEKRRFCP